MAWVPGPYSSFMFIRAEEEQRKSRGRAEEEQRKSRGRAVHLNISAVFFFFPPFWQQLVNDILDPRLVSDDECLC